MSKWPPSLADMINELRSAGHVDAALFVDAMYRARPDEAARPTVMRDRMADAMKRRAMFWMLDQLGVPRKDIVTMSGVPNHTVQSDINHYERVLSHRSTIASQSRCALSSRLRAAGALPEPESYGHGGLSWSVRSMVAFDNKQRKNNP